MTSTFPHGVVGSCSLEGVWGSSVALGVIAGKCGSLYLVLAGPVGCLRGRWRSGPRKWRHDAGSRARVSKHRAPEGALRLKVILPKIGECTVSKHRAPEGALRHGNGLSDTASQVVSKHRAPEGALRRCHDALRSRLPHVSKHRAPEGALRPSGSYPGSNSSHTSASTAHLKVH